MAIKTKTLKVRVKDKHAKQLAAMAFSVNQVWNYINELSHRSICERGEFLSAYDIQKYTAGANKELGIHSQTVQGVASEYATRRNQFKKARLNWRKSHGVRRSLGWIPLKSQSINWKNGQIFHNGQYFKVWDSYGLSQYKFRSGSFNEDARGRWYFNVVVSIEAQQPKGRTAIGIDLGCKDVATCSDGTRLAGRWYRELEAKLGIAQRAGNRKRAKAIHAKMANRRKDSLHKISRSLVNENAAIFIGNISPKGIAKTKLAKSSLDAGWGMLTTMLKYKSDHAGVVCEKVNEAYSTQTCSCCGMIPDSSPKGRTGLGIREWHCSECGAEHDRDINAANNILVAGHRHLAVGITAL